jgi:hypothetical protein
MEWLTDELRERLLEAGKRQADADRAGHRCALPVLTCLRFKGGTWLLASLRPDEPNLAFGLCHWSGGPPEMGYVDLRQLASLRYDSGKGVYEDPMFQSADRLDLTQYADMAEIAGCIALQFTVSIDDEALIEQLLAEKAEDERLRKSRKKKTRR